MKTIIDDCEDYFGRPEISNSMMKVFREAGPWTYYHRYIAKTIEDPAPTDALRLGTAFHNYMEWLGWGENSPSEPCDYVIELPGDVDGEPLNMRKKTHRELVEGIREDAGSIPCLTPDEMKHTIAMVQSVLSNNATGKYRFGSGFTCDCEAVGINKIEDMEVKAKADILTNVGIIVDYKTTRHSTREAFARDAIYKYKYHRQAAHYLDVFEAEKFVIIAVRNFEPYESLVYEVPSRLIDEGRETNHAVLRDIKYCFAMDQWHTPGWGGVTLLVEDE